MLPVGRGVGSLMSLMLRPSTGGLIVLDVPAGGDLVPDELTAFAHRLSTLTDPDALRRIADKGGMAGKKAALDAAARDLGGDRRFSGMRRKVALSAGYDIQGTAAHINMRPAGLWILAESGRQQSGPIYPRGGARKGRGPVRGRAVRTPQGIRARSSYGPSRGLDTFSDAVRDARRDVPKAAAKQFTDEVRRIVR